MTYRPPPAETILAQAQQLDAAGQKAPSLDLINEYFQKLRIKAWDSTHDRMAQLCLQLSADLSLPVPAVIKNYVKFSADYGIDVLPEVITKYVDQCQEKTIKEQEHAKEEEKKCTYPLLQSIDLPKLLAKSIVDPAINFMFNTYQAVLREVATKPKYESLFHSIIQKAFELTYTYDKADRIEDLYIIITGYTSHTDIKGEATQRVIQSYYSCYQAALNHGLISTAITALNDANELVLNSKTPVPFECVEKIEVAKLDLLQKAGYKLFAAVQRSNLYGLYKKKKIKTEISLNQMLNMALMESATAPLIEKIAYKSVLPQINFPRFLDQASGQIPNRTELIRRLLDQTTKSTPLTEFIVAAEFEKDPFEICEKFIAFETYSKDQDLTNNLIGNLKTYAALRAIENICHHYTTIKIIELVDMISWYDSTQIQELIIKASRMNLIPGHINQIDGCVEFAARGSQGLLPSLSPINGQLSDIFDHFQRIKKNLPIAATQAKEEKNQQKEVYDERPRVMNERFAEIKRLRRLQKEERKRREEENRRKQEEKQREAEEKEIALRKQEEANKKERDILEHQYNVALTEIRLICRDLDEDVEEFLAKPLPSNLKREGKKSEDLNWIKEKNHIIKTQAIKTKRSQSEKIQSKMAKVKREIGEKRVLYRLAYLHKLDSTYDNEPEEVNAAIESCKAERETLYKTNLKVYKKVHELCKNADEQYKQLKEVLSEKIKEEDKNRVQVQPNPMQRMQQPPIQSVNAQRVQQPTENDNEDNQPIQRKAQPPPPQAVQPKPVEVASKHEEEEEKPEPFVSTQKRAQPPPPSQPAQQEQKEETRKSSYVPPNRRQGGGPQAEEFNPSNSGNKFTPSTGQRFQPQTNTGGSRFTQNTRPGMNQQPPPQQPQPSSGFGPSRGGDRFGGGDRTGGGDRYGGGDRFGGGSRGGFRGSSRGAGPRREYDRAPRQPDAPPEAKFGTLKKSQPPPPPK